MSIFDDVNNWEKTEGADIFSSILDVSDPVILDYGCGAGNYSFAAAQAFGQKCKVYAVDINKQCLDYVNSKAKDEKITVMILIKIFLILSSMRTCFTEKRKHITGFTVS